MKWLTLLFTLFILLIIVLADQGRLGVLGVINRIPLGDKLGHLSLYGLLTLLLDLTAIRALPGQTPARLVLQVGLSLALILGLEEYSQQFYRNRTYDLVDLAFSYLGLLAGSWLALRPRK